MQVNTLTSCHLIILSFHFFFFQAHTHTRHHYLLSVFHHQDIPALIWINLGNKIIVSITRESLILKHWTFYLTTYKLNGSTNIANHWYGAEMLVWCGPLDQVSTKRPYWYFQFVQCCIYYLINSPDPIYITLQYLPRTNVLLHWSATISLTKAHSTIGYIKLHP
jgi:hypothetical protein